MNRVTFQEFAVALGIVVLTALWLFAGSGW